MREFMERAAHSLLLGVLCFGFVPGPVARAQSDEEAARGRKILEAALAKRGGREALEKIKDYEFTMTGTMRSASAGEAKIHAVRKVLFGETPCLLDRARVTFPASGQEIPQEITLKGREGRRRTRLEGKRLSESEVAEQWAGFHRSSVGILRALLDRGAEFEAVGPGKVGEKTTEVIRVLRPHEPPLEVDIHPDSGCFLRVRWQERPRSGAPPVPQEILYGDFRALGSLAGEPFKAEVRVGGSTVSKRRTEAAKVNVGLKPSDFPLE
jgi:hypothetical protein